MTTAYTGAQTSYTDTDPQVRCIEELIHNVSPSATPLTKLIGLSSLNNPAVFSTKYEWLEDTLDPVSALVSAVSTTNGTQITLTTTTDSKFFRVGHIVELDSELMWVSATDYAGVLTVTRDFAGTAGATHATGTEVKIVGIAMIEGADAPTGFTLDIATNYNYTQIFEDVVKVTGTQGSVKNYGFSNSAEYQMEKKFKSLAVLIERALFHGYRDAGSASAPRAMGGMHQYITDNLTAMSSTALTEKVVMDAMQSCFTDVGQEFMPNLLVCNGWLHRKIAGFYEPNTRMDQKERSGGVWVNQIDSQFGKLDIMLNQWCPSDELWLLHTDLIGIGSMPGRAFFKQDLAISGDYKITQVVGEYSCAIRCDRAHAGITGCSTST